MSNPPPPWPHNGPPYQNQNQNQNQQQYSQPMQYGQPQYGYQPQYGQPPPQPIFINHGPVFNVYHFYGGPPAQGPIYPPMQQQQQMGHPPLGSMYPQQQAGPTYQQMPYGGGPVPQTGPGFVETDSIAATSVPSRVPSPKPPTTARFVTPLTPRYVAPEEQEPDLSSGEAQEYGPPPFEQDDSRPTNRRRAGASHRTWRKRKNTRQPVDPEPEVSSATDTSDLEAEAFANWRVPPLLLAKYDNDRRKLFAEAGPTCIAGWQLQKKHESTNPLAIPQDRAGRARRS